MGPDKNQYIPEKGYSIPTKRCINVHVRLRPDFTSKLVHVLAFGTPKFYIAPYDKIKHELVNLSSNCDVKSGLSIGHKICHLNTRSD